MAAKLDNGQVDIQCQASQCPELREERNNPNLWSNFFSTNEEDKLMQIMGKVINQM